MSQIKVGDTLPDATFAVMTSDGPGQRTSAEIFDGRKVAVFALPGAFTPTCNANHLPSFVAQAGALKAKGVEEICCVSVNDVFVQDAWSKATASGDAITMLADGSAAFTKAAGMELDLTERGLGVRSHRYAMIVEDGTVATLLIENSPGEAVASSADALLAAM